jgi:hypothetical protein
MSIWDWWPADDAGQRRVLRIQKVLCWVALPPLVALLLAIPWLDCQFNPPFGRSWWWTGGSPECGSPREVLSWGAFMLVMFGVAWWLTHRRKDRAE